MGGGDGYQEAPILRPSSLPPACWKARDGGGVAVVASPMLLQGEGGVLHRLLLFERGSAASLDSVASCRCINHKLECYKIAWKMIFDAVKKRTAKVWSLVRKSIG